jgi:hydroxymethylpyrimidine/phosphomethylpyrimidine kinase
MRCAEADLTIAAMHSALSIAGSDPTGGAGIQADLQVFRHLGVHGCAVITALTIQDTSKVHSVLPVFPSVVLDQLRVVLNDTTPGAVKIGMLASDDVARSVELGLESLPAEVPIVLDPILLASDGTPLLERRAWGTLRALCARATLLTPNVPELTELCGRDASSRAAGEDGARHCIEELGAQAVLLKGGHRDGSPDDLLATCESDGIRFAWLAGERIDAGPVHGTGCALASAITARLAQGESLSAAVGSAREFVASGLRRAATLGAGARVLGYS